MLSNLPFSPFVNTHIPSCEHMNLSPLCFLHKYSKLKKKKLHTLDNALWFCLGEYQQELILKSSNVTTRVAV